MEDLNYGLVSLSSGKQYFVLESIMYEYDTYDLILNVEDENDIKIVSQDVKNGKTILNDVTDTYLLKTLSSLFDKKIREKQQNM